jgi:hypothetical protein
VVVAGFKSWSQPLVDDGARSAAAGRKITCFCLFLLSVFQRLLVDPCGIFRIYIMMMRANIYIKVRGLAWLLLTSS